MTIVMSDTMSRVGTKIQKVKIRIKSFLSNSAMTFETTNNQGGPLVSEQKARDNIFIGFIVSKYVLGKMDSG